jgi:hypothetical protein
MNKRYIQHVPFMRSQSGLTGSKFWMTDFFFPLQTYMRTYPAGANAIPTRSRANVCVWQPCTHPPSPTIYLSPLPHPPGLSRDNAETMTPQIRLRRRSCTYGNNEALNGNFLGTQSCTLMGAQAKLFSLLCA